MNNNKALFFNAKMGLDADGSPLAKADRDPDSRRSGYFSTPPWRIAPSVRSCGMKPSFVDRSKILWESFVSN